MAKESILAQYWDWDPIFASVDLIIYLFKIYFIAKIKKI